MSLGVRIVIVSAAIVALIGCDRLKSASHAKSPSAATTQSTQAPTTNPLEDVMQSLTLLEGDDARSCDFPPAAIYIDRDEKTAILYSRQRTDAKGGNSYYLVIPLTDDSLESLDGYEWKYESPTTEHQDSLEGIFLEGQRFQLQPTELTVAFHADGSQMNISVDGHFLRYDTFQGGEAGTPVAVKGVLSASDVK